MKVMRKKDTKIASVDEAPLVNEKLGGNKDLKKDAGLYYVCLVL